VVRVPKSYTPPHRVTFKNSGRFWARSSAGKYEPNVEELRRIFTEAPLIAERARAFRIERTARIAAHEAPASLKDGGTLVLHVVPFAAFDFGQSFSLDEVSAHPEKFAPIGGTARDFQITFDGFLTASTAGGLSAPQHAYVQVFRTGAVEAVASSLAVASPLVVGKGNNVIARSKIQAWIIQYSRHYATSLQMCGSEPPFAIMVSLVDVKGKVLLQDYLDLENAILEDLPSMTLNREQFHFVETIFQNVPENDQDAAKQLKATLDHLANAAGASLYTHIGILKPRSRRAWISEAGRSKGSLQSSQSANWPNLRELYTLLPILLAPFSAFAVRPTIPVMFVEMAAS
jgi:hypothetical protein